MERVLTKVGNGARWWLTVLLAVMLIETIAFSNAMQPVLPLGQAAKTELFSASLLADPYLESSAVTDESAAAELAEEIKQLSAEMRLAQGTAKADLQERTFDAYAVLCLYLADKSETDASDNKIRARAHACSQNLIHFAHSIRAAGKGSNAVAPAKRARMDFHVLAQGYLMGRKATALQGFRKLTANKNLDRRLKGKVEVILAVAASESSRGREKLDNLASLARMAQALEAKPRTSVLATAARIAAPAARGSDDARAVFNRLAKLATQAASNLHPELHDAVLRHVVASWQTAQGQRMNWGQPPMQLDPFVNQPTALAVVERNALQKFFSGRHADGIRIYEALAAGAFQTKNETALNRRLLDLYELEYLKTDKPQRYEQKLGEALAAAGADQAVRAKHKAFIARETAVGKNQKTGNGRRSLVIAVLSNYSASLQGKSQRPVAEDIAGMYFLNRQYAASTAIYLELAEDADAGEKVKFLTLAAGSQHLLAGVGNTPNFNKRLPANEATARLMAIYHDLRAVQPSWANAAMLGLLQVAHGQAASAFAAWDKQIADEPRNPLASEAAGLMLVTYLKAKDWDRQVALLKLCLDKQVAARHQGRGLDMQGLYGTALLEGGKEAHAQGDYRQAKAYLSEFTQKFKAHGRRSEALYLLATAAHELKEYPLALKSCNEIVDLYPASQEMHPALLFGGNLAQNMALEEYTIKYYSLFLSRFPQDGESRQVNESLMAVYTGKQLFAEAAYLYGLRLASRLYSAEEKLQAKEMLMTIEHRHGDGGKAKKLAQEVLGTAGMPDSVKAEAIRIIARETVPEAKDFSVLAPYLRMLDGSLDGGNPDVQDVRSELLFYKAELAWSGADEEIYSLELKDPVKKIAEVTSRFAAMKAAYLQPCFVSTAAYCAPANYQLARRAETVLSNIEGLDIASELSDQEVSTFRAKKDALVTEVTATVTKSDTRSLALVQNGGMSPDWASMILWNNQKDYIETTDATNFGYVEWNVQ